MDKSRKPVEGVEPILGGVRCEVCGGRKWIVPAAVQQVVIATGDDIRLDTLATRPPAVDPEGLAALRDILRQIREEVGDVWSPREQAGADTHVHGDVNAVVITGDKAQYIAKLRAMRGAPPLPSPTVEVSPNSSGGKGGPPTT